jgi:NAD(P) transhydrogenase subunit alpha
MDTATLLEQARKLSEHASAPSVDAEMALRDVVTLSAQTAMPGADAAPLVFFFTVFVLAIFVGYYVVWNVTSALHSPLMSVTNAISSVIIVGALIAAGPAEHNVSKVMGFVAVMLASVNIFGGFILTQRMLQMFRRKK